MYIPLRYRNTRLHFTEHVSALLGWCTVAAGSAGLDDMFCPQDQPYTCTGMHTIEQGDINSGSRTITSHVSSVSPNGTEVVDTTDNAVRLDGAAGVTIGKLYERIVLLSR